MLTILKSDRKVVKEVIINIFYLKFQLLPASCEDSGELIFQQDCHSTQKDTLVL